MKANINTKFSKLLSVSLFTISLFGGSHVIASSANKVQGKDLGLGESPTHSPKPISQNINQILGKMNVLYSELKGDKKDYIMDYGDPYFEKLRSLWKLYQSLPGVNNTTSTFEQDINKLYDYSLKPKYQWPDEYQSFTSNVEVGWYKEKTVTPKLEAFMKDVVSQFQAHIPGEVASVGTTVTGSDKTTKTSD